MVPAGQRMESRWPIPQMSLIACTIDRRPERRVATQPAIRIQERTIAGATIWSMDGGVDDSKLCSFPECIIESLADRCSVSHAVIRWECRDLEMRASSSGTVQRVPVFHYLVGWRKWKSS